MTDYVTGADLASFLERDQSGAIDNVAQRTNALIDEEWANPRSPVPQWVVNIAWDVAIRAGKNTQGVSSRTRAFDDITLTDRYPTDEQPGKVYLEDDERAKLNRDGQETSDPRTVAPKSIRMSIPGWTPRCY